MEFILMLAGAMLIYGGVNAIKAKSFGDEGQGRRVQFPVKGVYAEFLGFVFCGMGAFCILISVWMFIKTVTQ